MKIIVQNESEKKLIQRFLDAMHDLDMIDELSAVDVKFDDEDQYLLGDDEMFLKKAIFESTVSIDANEPQICVEHHNLTGVCAVCGGATDGTIDGDDIPYSEWLDYNSEEGLKSWKCESCLNKVDGEL